MRKINLFNCFLILIIINIVLITLAIYFYNDKFFFWAYPFSYLGASKTFNPLINNFGNIDNFTSQIIYSIDMFLSGVVMLVLTFNLYFNKKSDKNNLIVSLYFLAGMGFIIAAFSPDDIRHNYHVLVSALMVASFWILATNYISQLKNKNRKITLLYSAGDFTASHFCLCRILFSKHGSLLGNSAKSYLGELRLYIVIHHTILSKR